MTGEGMLPCAIFFVAAGLYSSVGHGGASAYLAVMALAGFAPETMRPVALWMNLAVSAVAAWAYFRAGHFRFRLFWPFAATAIPAAWLGGGARLHSAIFFSLVSLALAAAALRLFLPEGEGGRRAIPPGIALAAGAGIGLASGMAGIGGGVFLTPLLLLARWASPREAAAVSAPFIFVNSAAGIWGGGHVGAGLPEAFPGWLAAVVAGGLLGSGCGSRAGRPGWLRPALGAVLLVASAKFGMRVFG